MKHAQTILLLTVLISVLLSGSASASDLDSLMDAINSGNADKVRLVLKRNPKIVNFFVINGNRPLHYAVQQNSMEIVKILIQNGADVNAKNHIGVTPWETASAAGFLEIAGYLASKGARTYNRELQDAVCEVNAAKVEDILKAHPEQVNQKDGDGTTPLIMIAYSENIDMAKLLLAHGADVNAHNDSGTTPLQNAIYRKNQAMIELLLKSGADPNGKDNRGCTSLHIAVEQNEPDTAATLIKAGAKVNMGGYSAYTPLHIAAMNGRIKIMELLLANGANLNARTKEGKTPLKLALEYRRKDAAQMLKDRGGTK